MTLSAPGTEGVQAGLRQVGGAAPSGDAGARRGRIVAVEEAAGEASARSARRRRRRQGAARVPEAGRQLLQGDRREEKARLDAFRVSALLVAGACCSRQASARCVHRVSAAAVAADAACSAACSSALRVLALAALVLFVCSARSRPAAGRRARRRRAGARRRVAQHAAGGRRRPDAARRAPPRC